MVKIIRFLILYICIFIVETIGCFLMVLLYFVSDSLDFRGSFDSAVLWNFWRLLFYGLPFLILYFLLFKFVVKIRLYKPLLFSLFNLMVYVGLSVLSRIIWGKNVPMPPEGIMFWVTFVAVFLSPLILGQISYIKKLMESI